MKHTLKTLTATVLALSAFATNAEVRINGFASIVAGTTLDKDKSLFGYDENLSFKPESLFALQVASDLGDGLSATSQIIARGQDDYNAQFEWAYLTYNVSDSTQVSVGRMRIPFYRYSDYLDVGYAYNWIRPPESVYSLTFSSFDGASLLYSHTLGEWDSSIQIITGGFDGDVGVVSENDSAQLENIFGISWTVGNYWLTGRAVYMQADATISFDNNADPDKSLNQYIGLLGQIGQSGAANGLIIDGDAGSFLGIGFTVDYENFIVDSEYTEVKVDDSLIATQKQYYLSFAYRFDEWTPYVTIEHREDTNDDDYSAGLPQSIDSSGTAIPVRATYIATLASQEMEQDVVTVGARYNFHPSAALKFDYTQRDRNEVDESLLSVGIDLVF